MSEADDELARVGRNLRRRKRRRGKQKAATAVVPLPQSDPAPPSPGKIEQPPFMPGVGQVLEEELDTAELRPSIPKSRSVDVVLRVRHYEVLQWYAKQRGVTLQRAASEILGGAIAGLQVEYRRAKRGTPGGSVRRSEMPEVIGGPT